MANPYGRPKIPLIMRFALYTAVRDSGCHEWVGKINKNSGYGHITVRVDGAKLTRLVHRAAYEFFVGPIPDGLQVLHKCDNRICINPTHLYVGTQKDNVRDVIQRGQHGVKPKLSPAQVIQVRSLLAAGQTAVRIAKTYGVSPSLIDRIKAGRGVYLTKMAAM